MSSAALEPCPFCAYQPSQDDIYESGAGYDASYYSYAVWCECGVKTAPVKTKSQAIRAWNRRKKPTNSVPTQS